MWELHDGSAQAGPFAEEHVIGLIHTGIPAGTVARRVGETEWRSLSTHAAFAIALGQRATAQPAGPRFGKRTMKRPFIGVGCLVQGLGLIGFFVLAALFGFPVGLLLGLVAMLVLMIVGRVVGTEWSCSACGNRLAGENVTTCPVCRATLS